MISFTWGPIQHILPELHVLGIVLWAADRIVKKTIFSSSKSFIVKKQSQCKIVSAGNSE